MASSVEQLKVENVTLKFVVFGTERCGKSAVRFCFVLAQTRANLYRFYGAMSLISSPMLIIQQWVRSFSGISSESFRPRACIKQASDGEN